MHRISKVIYTWTHRSNWAHAGVWWGPPATCLEAFVQLYRRFQQAEAVAEKRPWMAVVLGGPVGGRIKQQGNKDYTDQQVMQSIIYGPLRTQFHLMTFKVIKSLKSQYLDLDQSNHIFGCSMFQSILASAPRSTASTEF